MVGRPSSLSWWQPKEPATLPTPQPDSEEVTKRLETVMQVKTKEMVEIMKEEVERNRQQVRAAGRVGTGRLV